MIIDVMKVVTSRAQRGTPSAGNIIKSEKLVKSGNGVYAIDDNVALVRVDSCSKIIELPEEVSVAIIHVAGLRQIYMTGDYRSKETMLLYAAYGNEDEAKETLRCLEACAKSSDFTKEQLEKAEKLGSLALSSCGVLESELFSQRPDNGVLVSDFSDKAWNYLLNALSPKSNPAVKSSSRFQSIASGLAQLAGKIGGSSADDENDVEPAATAKPAAAVVDPAPASAAANPTATAAPVAAAAEPVTIVAPEPAPAEPDPTSAEPDDDMFGIDDLTDIDDA